MKYSGAKGISDHTNSSNVVQVFAYIAQTSLKVKSGMLYSPLEFFHRDAKYGFRDCVSDKKWLATNFYLQCALILQTIGCKSNAHPTELMYYLGNL